MNAVIKTLRLGTRSSQLALWQANQVKDELEKAGWAVELVTFETQGDKILDKALSKIGSKGLFTAELEEQLISGDLDLAVHSAKDLPSKLPAGLEIAAFMQREKPHDVLVSFDASLKLASENLVLGTSSTRRRAFLKAHYPNVHLVEMRGNLQTRFNKMKSGVCDAMILAYAGVKRSGFEQYIVEHLDAAAFVPPVGQGSVAIEMATTNPFWGQIRKILNHESTENCLLAERKFLGILNGGCSVPVFAYATETDGQIDIIGGVLSLDGAKKCFASARSMYPVKAGKDLAALIIDQGGLKILEEIKNQI